MTADAKVRLILLAAARDVYQPHERKPVGIQVDTRCGSCGVARPSCPSRTCIRREASGE